MSAYRAVSVTNWSWTTVNRSSRFSPSRTFCWSAAMTAGLLFQTYRARIAGFIDGSVRTRPSWIMFTCRVPFGARSGRLSADRFACPIETAPAMPPDGHCH